MPSPRNRRSARRFDMRRRGGASSATCTRWRRGRRSPSSRWKSWTRCDVREFGSSYRCCHACAMRRRRRCAFSCMCVTSSTEFRRPRAPPVPCDLFFSCGRFLSIYFDSLSLSPSSSSFRFSIFRSFVSLHSLTSKNSLSLSEMAHHTLARSLARLLMSYDGYMQSRATAFRNRGG